MLGPLAFWKPNLWLNRFLWWVIDDLKPPLVHEGRRENVPRNIFLEVRLALPKKLSDHIMTHPCFGHCYIYICICVYQGVYIYIYICLGWWTSHLKVLGQCIFQWYFDDWMIRFEASLHHPSPLGWCRQRQRHFPGERAEKKRWYKMYRETKVTMSQKSGFKPFFSDALTFLFKGGKLLRFNLGISEGRMRGKIFNQ